MGMLVAAEEGAADERPCLTMFESKEEVERTMLALKIFPDIDQVVAAEQEEPETDEEEYAAQVFPEHTAAETRYTRSLYYGALPATDRPSLPLTRLAVDQFTNTGLDALGQKLGRLDMARAADISRQACAGPNSLVLALLYLERLRQRNPDYLTTVSSADLFLVSLMVASKFLHDDGEEDEVFNDEWASSGGIDTKELNRLEVKFLAAMDWRIFVDDAEFQSTLSRLEADIAIREVTARDGDATYSDLSVLGSGEQAAHMLSLLAQAAIKACRLPHNLCCRHPHASWHCCRPLSHPPRTCPGVKLCANPCLRLQWAGGTGGAPGVRRQQHERGAEEPQPRRFGHCLSAGCNPYLFTSDW